jgi:c-di-GMP-binding flagellar brake protein YcgR
METRPMALDAMTAAHGGLEAYRLSAPSEVADMLRRLQEANVLLNMNTPHGAVYTTTLWATDAARGVLSFAAEPNDPQVQALLAGDEAVVVGYFENIKVQFDVHSLLLVHGARASALNTAYPRELYRFQRRDSFRVRPILRDAPMARLRHPMLPDMEITLRVLDVSIGGCALLLPADIPVLSPGVLINRVRIELNLDARFDTALRLQHVTAIQPDARGARLGCELVNLGQDAERVLQRYIDQTQKRRRVMALE